MLMKRSEGRRCSTVAWPEMCIEVGNRFDDNRVIFTLALKEQLIRPEMNDMGLRKD